MQDKSFEKPCKFFVAVVCPLPLQYRVNQIKIWVKEEYHCRVPMNSPPHLTLIPPFWSEPQNESQVLNALDSFQYISGIPEIRLLNFSHFDRRVLYIRVIEDPVLLDLKQKLESYFISILGGAIVNDDRPFHPHITLAQPGRRGSAFHRAIKQFATREFEDRFLAEKISLLKHDRGSWQVIAEKKVGG
ncbi:MAG TPA: 2'-5' RNA ligase family protein [Cyclobacteriaceae bacterium]|nr:2'-5' RNA ligase family protein [Cyclobacteriaceae bacterium]